MATIKTLTVAIIDYDDIKQEERLKEPNQLKLRDIEDTSILIYDIIIFDNAFETQVLKLPLI
jgi:hypothetical protein